MIKNMQKDTDQTSYDVFEELDSSGSDREAPFGDAGIPSLTPVGNLARYQPNFDDEDEGMA